jgi:hypothetical protein
VLYFHSLNFEKFHTTLGCKEVIDAGKYPIATTITILIIIAFIAPLVNNAGNGRPLRRTSPSCALKIDKR